MNESPVALHAIVYGRVQKVGFRAAACRFARALQVTGSVRNCLDGSVEIYAVGPRSRLDSLLAELKAHFKIDSINADYTIPTTIYNEFHVI